MTEIKDARIIHLPRFNDPRGNLSFLEQKSHLPFEIRKTYWIYDVPGGEEREGHAFRENEEFIVSLSGAFDVIVDDGKEQRTFSLSRSYYGLLVPKGLWRTMVNFSTNSVALVVSSTDYTPEDYVEDYQEFLKLKHHGEI